MKKALLIIDMQKGSFTPKTPRFDTEGVVKRINSLSASFRKQKDPVIYIQHDGLKSGQFEKGSEEWEILGELEIEPTDLIIDKYANDAFYHSQLQETLNSSKVDHLFITGCATDFCVESTVQSALVKGFNITIVADAHTTGERPHLKAIQVIDHYNWVWKNMMPTTGSIQVVNFEDV